MNRSTQIELHRLERLRRGQVSLRIIEQSLVSPGKALVTDVQVIVMNSLREFTPVFFLDVFKMMFVLLGQVVRIHEGENDGGESDVVCNLSPKLRGTGGMVFNRFSFFHERLANCIPASSGIVLSWDGSGE